MLGASPRYGIDPGTLALAVAYRRNAWPVAMAAMKLIQPKPLVVSDLVYNVARAQLDLARLGSDSAVFIERALGIGDA